MPFTSYKQSLDPETLHAAYEAFDLGLAEIQKINSYDPQEARDLLAKRVVQAALEQRERHSG